MLWCGAHGSAVKEGLPSPFEHLPEGLLHQELNASVRIAVTAASIERLLWAARMRSVSRTSSSRSRIVMTTMAATLDRCSH